MSVSEPYTELYTKEQWQFTIASLMQQFCWSEAEAEDHLKSALALSALGVDGGALIKSLVAIKQIRDMVCFTNVS